jgi:hypothetical protein
MKYVAYVCVSLLGAASLPSLLYPANTAKPVQKQVKVKFWDWDGCIAEDVHPMRQFLNAKNVMKTRREFWKALWEAKISLAKIAFQSRWYGDSYDANGARLIGNWAHIKEIAKSSSTVEERADDIIKALAIAKPYYKNIEKAQQAQKDGDLVIIMTNNDRPSLDAKLEYVNTKLKEAGKAPFEPNGRFCVGSDEQIDSFPSGKPDKGYYKKGLSYSKKLLKEKYPNIDIKTVQFGFIDDKAKYLAAFEKTALEDGVKIDIVLCPNNEDAFARNYDAVFGKLQEAQPQK